MTSTELSPGRRPTAQAWWRDSVIYQLYVRSFADSTGNGVGDLDGITGRLDHIAGLGVDGLWLNPCYPSPNRDGGYDVADYLTIDQQYGGLPAFQRLLDGAHARGLKVVMDLVPNHCSDQHAWFQAALVAGPGSAERDRFMFRPGLGEDGSQPPNNWRSVFGGPAWTRLADGEWYLHSFDATQPDFNWADPEVVAMFDDVLTTWFDRGIDGFRIDVAYAMVKHPELPDLDDLDADNPYQWNQPGVHAIFHRWRALAQRYDRELTLVGEVWLPPSEAVRYIRPGELTQVFYFDLLQQPFEAAAFRTSLTQTLEGVAELPDGSGVPTWALNSHDVHRSVTRYGLVEPEPMTSVDLNATRTRARGRVDVALGTARAKAALLLTLALPGSVYLYQGEELGLPEVQDLPADARRDPIWARSAGTEHGRDGSRVPLPWTSDATSSLGFSPGGAAPAWLPQPAWYADLAADQQGSDDSTLAFYRRAIACRATLVGSEPLRWLETGRADVLAFSRGDTVCVTVFAGDPYLPEGAWGSAVLRSDGRTAGAIAADSTAWLRRDGGAS